MSAGREIGSFNGKTPRRGHCYWCNGLKPMTADHLIPSWARPLIKVTHPGHPLLGVVDACLGCNNGKGAMPPAVFWAARRDPDECRTQEAKWSAFAIQSAYAFAHMTVASRQFIMTEMTREYAGVLTLAGDPPAERPPWLDNWPSPAQGAAQSSHAMATGNAQVAQAFNELQRPRGWRP